MKRSRIAGLLAGLVVVAGATFVGPTQSAVAAPAPETGSTVTQTLAAPAPASAADEATSATGQYEYICIFVDGRSLALPSGSVGQCPEGSSYIHRYIDGRFLQAIKLTAAGEPATASIQCVVAIATSATAIVISPVSGLMTLVRMTAAEALGYRPCA